MRPEVEAAVERFVGCRVVSARPCRGGDISEAYELTLAGRLRVFVKTHGSVGTPMFAAEARGLEWLGAANALRVPRVLAVSVDPPFLLLEHLGSSPPGPLFDEELARGLAEVHRTGAPSYGLDHDNFIGRLPQSNEPRTSWPDFYREMRLEPQVRMAEQHGLVSPGVIGKFEKLFAVLAERVGPPEPPARLHGDLWSGNLHADEHGAPCLIDPAAYGGHREMDLAMMRLFGGFSERVFRAYDEVWPLAPGYEERVPLYQLYPLLVHVNLFGSSYVPAMERALRAVL